jgi:hypothetical protein
VFELGLCLALVSSLVVNWAYAKEHDAAAALPPLTFRAPLRSLRLLLGARAWLVAFGAETAGWLVYVAALRLAPIALVQAVSAGGIAVLAFVSCHGRIGALSWRQRAAVAIAFVGLALLGLSLAGGAQADQPPSALGVLVWLASCAGGAFLAVAVLRVGVPAARFGLAAGLLFAGGDISAKVIGYGGAWFAVVIALIVCSALGTSVLQGAFQRGSALTAAGIATLTTNAVPIAAGFALFSEELPPGVRGPLQIAAFAAIVVSATMLGRPEAERRNQEAPNQVVETWQSRPNSASVP